MIRKEKSSESYEAFLELYPEYEDTKEIDEIRKKEFSRLDRDKHIYFDYTGGGLYGESQIRNHEEFLLNNVIGNPHSTNPTSTVSTDHINRARRRVLEFFNASPEEYITIFTANATHALKLVGEGYPFCEGDVFLLTYDNHNSVNGIREFDRVRGSETRYIPVIPPDMRVPGPTLDTYIGSADTVCNKLFAYPAQSNFSGVHHPLEWIEKARAQGWDVLLDAAAFVPTNRLDLGIWKPDYVAISFYKMFGYPTGVGALIARRESLEKLHRPWFAGGTIVVASVQADQYFLEPGALGFEDGTLNYASFPAVEGGLDFLDSIGIDVIHKRVTCLTGWLLLRLLSLRHGNGRALISLYGPADAKDRGGTVAINVLDSCGVAIDHDIVEERANKRNISLRTGCFCNPGAGEMALGLTRDEIEKCFNTPEARMSYDQFRMCINNKSVGAVRLSLGHMTNFEDVRVLVNFFKEFLDE